MIDGSSASAAFEYLAQANAFPDGTYFVRVSPTLAKQLVVQHWGGRAWGLVMRKSLNPDTSVYSVDAVGNPTSTFDGTSASSFKLADAELHYLTTATTNPSVWGVVLVPNWNNGHVAGNLLRSDASSRAYPVGGSVTKDAGDMIKFSLDATSYPSGSWDTTLSSNSHCGGDQVWANWESSESYKMRWIAPGGCSYFNEVVNGLGTGEIAGGIWAWAH